MLMQQDASCTPNVKLQRQPRMARLSKRCQGKAEMGKGKARLSASKCQLVNVRNDKARQEQGSRQGKARLSMSEQG